jgi:glyoxylase-like metal-dependent hydrolase (beta-lactamase superfamily II)
MRATDHGRERTAMNNTTSPGRQVGAFSITAISDGDLPGSLDLLSNIDPQEAARMQHAAGVHDAATIHIGTYLVRGAGRTILIDAGAGGYKQWGGKLTTNLVRAGVRPTDIDTILLTHAHPDHVGGLLDAAGHACFADAELVMHAGEHAFWSDDGNLSRASARARGNFQLARQVFARYRHRLRTFVAGDVLPGIAAMPLPGHTAGHCGYRLESAGQAALVWGDIVHFPQIQVPRPDVAIAFDQDPQLATATRSRLLDAVSADGLLIAGMHLGERGFAHVIRTGTRYALAYTG